MSDDRPERRREGSNAASRRHLRRQLQQLDGGAHDGEAVRPRKQTRVWPSRVPFRADDLDAVLRRTVEQLQADLAAEGFAVPAVDATVEGSVFLFDIVKDGQRRWWRYVIDEPVYAYVPDGTDPDALTPAGRAGPPPPRAA